MFYFSYVYKLYEKYKTENLENPIEGFHLGYTIDGLEILEQLDYLIKETTILNNFFFDRNEVLTNKINNWMEYSRENNINSKKYLIQNYHKISEISDYKKFEEMLFKTKLYAEMFYYKAFRLRNIIRYSAGLGKSFESKGIRNVRNILIEHPEKSGLEYIHTFGLGVKEFGPILKSGNQYNDSKFKDPGLFINASEFKTNLEKILINYKNKKLL
ncbi:hypothetical protein [Marixanthomonas ophiurae]|uniref:Uncharacterized protein n=1 Tax=Marixanthomonas ophiurae TaxID=387659 RepID=A0A3E1QAP0_9FLAO|nr:hypothetical protein [Marixanthomonas ophiurae]RFN59205.1 hypothetical protein DZ858_03785 [Marixanthomonas ophiurae]